MSCRAYIGIDQRDYGDIQWFHLVSIGDVESDEYDEATVRSWIEAERWLIGKALWPYPENEFTTVRTGSTTPGGRYSESVDGDAHHGPAGEGQAATDFPLLRRSS